MFSQDAIHHIGFTEPVHAGGISAKFSRIYFFDIGGIHSSETLLQSHFPSEIDNVEIILSTNVDMALEAAIGSDWKMLDVKITPDLDDQIFAFVRITLTDEIPCELCNSRIPQTGVLQTFEGFKSAACQLDEKSETILPAVCALLTFALSRDNQPVTPKTFGSVDFGRSSDGSLVLDHVPKILMNVITTHRIELKDIDAGLVKAKQLRLKARKNSLKHFGYALAERDDLKRFLYFFLFLEVETHRVFKAIEHKEVIDSLISTDQHPRRANIAEMFASDFDKKVKNICDRFVWCAFHVWVHLDESDISDFNDLKSLRNKIAHGETPTASLADAKKAENLARKLLTEPPLAVPNAHVIRRA